MGITDVFNAVFGFVLGIIASRVFLNWQISIKPRIAISPMAAYDPDDGVLGIRIINRSRRQATDIQVLLFVAEKQGSWYNTIYTPELSHKFLFALDRPRFPRTIWEPPVSSIFETRNGPKIVELLSAQGQNERRLLFTLSAIDALSSSKVIQRVAYQLSDIQYGNFCPGRDFAIMPKPLPE